MNKLVTTIITLAAALYPMAGRTIADNSQITVISYNIRYGTAEDGKNSWTERRLGTIGMIKDQKPDILCLQEAFSFQNDFISLYCTGYSHIGRSRLAQDAEHPSIFYNSEKIRLIDWGNFWLSPTPEKVSLGWDAACERNATWAKMEYIPSGKKVFLVNTHLDHVGKNAREEGLRLILKKIDELNTENLPVILTGDFNAEPGDPSISFIDNKMHNARDMAEQTDSLSTFNGWGNSSTSIDYIFYRGFNRCTLYRTIQEGYSGIRYISDHYPIKATLVF